MKNTTCRLVVAIIVITTLSIEQKLNNFLEYVMNSSVVEDGTIATDMAKVSYCIISTIVNNITIAKSCVGAERKYC